MAEQPGRVWCAGQLCAVPRPTWLGGSDPISPNLSRPPRSSPGQPRAAGQSEVGCGVNLYLYTFDREHLCLHESCSRQTLHFVPLPKKKPRMTEGEGVKARLPPLSLCAGCRGGQEVWLVSGAVSCLPAPLPPSCQTAGAGAGRSSYTDHRPHPHNKFHCRQTLAELLAAPKLRSPAGENVTQGCTFQ